MNQFEDPTGNFKNYKWGIFYANKADLRVFVPKRMGFGYTLNFSNPYAIAGFILFLLVIFGQLLFR
jgi:uncharacterized membrane protein